MLRVLVLFIFAPAIVNAAGVRLEVDLNGDGVIQSSDVPGDLTRPDHPFVFWTNADQDDLEESETWPVQRPDHGTNPIDSIRDLEDLHQVRIVLPGAPDLAGGSLTFSLRSDGDPALNLFPAADASCANQHLVSLHSAEVQLQPAYRMPLGRVTRDRPLQVPINGLAREPGGSVCLLLEGAAAGVGELMLSLERQGEVSHADDPLYFS